MSLINDITNSFRRKLREGVDNISDKEAEEGWDELEDKDLDNDGDTDKSDSYLYKRQGIVAKMDENALGINEPYYVEIAVRDARKAVEAIRDVPQLSKALRTKQLVPYGSNIFATKDETIFELLSNILSENDIELYDQQGLDEMSTTGGVEGYMTPKAFGDADEDTYTQGGMEKVKETNRIFKPMGRTKHMESKSSYKSMMAEMYGVQNEAVSYRDYKKDESASPSQKVNKGIQEVNAMLAEIEKIVHNNLRLKTEMGVNSSQFWKKTSGRIGKINERIVRISNKLKELSK
jgi:cell fate (sporulation/competence/biofilm development) regulator YmcA (YheA/YmcA/DUF963 family)